MRILRNAFIVLTVSSCALLTYALANAMYTDTPVGFQQTTAANPGGPAIPIALWYPTDARPWPTLLIQTNLVSVAKGAPVRGQGLPLVVISHGNGGGPGGHVDLALALAQHGFAVAALMHPGDNYLDASAAGSERWLVDRGRDVRAALDHLLQRWPSRASIDAGRVGIFGFSAGGFTALSAIGGQPDLRLLAAHCSTAADEFVCKLLAQSKSPLLDPARVPPATAFARDVRIKAAVLAAPGLGFVFPPEGLKSIDVPVQLWTGSADVNVPTATNAAPIGQALGARAELREVAGAGHFAFLAPCGLFGPPPLCRDAAGFDRARFHAQMNEAVSVFFQQRL